MRISEIQEKMVEWLQHNFPNSGWQDQFMGVVEEVGELSHSLLKQKQGIRGTYEQHEADAIDAVGDIAIYLLALCIRRGWDFEKIVNDTFDVVMKRDWKARPNGPE